MKLLFAVALFTALVSSKYTPEKVDCPGGRLVREAKGLSQQESDWIANKAKSDHLKNFLEGAHLDDFDANKFLADAAKDHHVSVGLAFSGGGDRAMLCGAGFISALDNRTEGAHEEALGGLLQSADYITGLSGGSWLLGSLVMNNFTSVQDILDNKTQIWDLSYSIFDAKGGTFDVVKYYLQLAADVLFKKLSGFQCTLTDIWGRALSHHFFGGANFGDDLRWSNVQNMPEFTNHEMPYPIVVANSVLYGSKNATAHSPIMEISPFEFGSWDNSINSFAQTKYLGTNMTNGNPVSTTCYSGFDNPGFILGASSTLFNEIFGTQVEGRLSSTRFNSTVQGELNRVLSGSPSVDHFVAAFHPNPFKNVAEAHNKSFTEPDILQVVDGGEDHQNVPLYPLVQKARGVDVIFAFDSSADNKQNWPNGNAMYQVYQRQFVPEGSTMSVPKMPDSDTFIKEGLTSKPVFFGCDAKTPSPLTSGGPSNITTVPSNGTTSENLTQEDGDKVPPLIVYIANRQISYASNTSTFTFVYPEKEKRGMIQNGYDVASRHGGKEDKQWKVCVACAIIKREQDRKGIQQSEQCKKCFEEYCWKG